MLWISPRFYFTAVKSRDIKTTEKKCMCFETEWTLSNFMLFTNGSLFDSMFHIHNHITGKKDIKTKVKKMTEKKPRCNWRWSMEKYFITIIFHNTFQTLLPPQNSELIKSNVTSVIGLFKAFIKQQQNKQTNIISSTKIK